MASTVEAVFAAMQMDGAGQEQLHKVMARFGVQHKLVDPIQRAWIHHAVRSELNLPNRFFIGHHFRLQGTIFKTKLTRPQGGTLPRKRGNKVWRRIKSSWKTIKRLWLGPRKNRQQPTVRPASQQQRKPLALKSTTRSPNVVKALAGESRSTATKTVNTPCKNVATGETTILSKESLGRFEDDEQAAALEQATEKEDPVQKHGAAEVSPPAKPTPARTPKPQPKPALAKGATSADDRVKTGNASQDSNKACRDKPASEPSSKDDAATGVELGVAHQPHEASEAEPVKATKASNPQITLEQRLNELKKKVEELKAGQRSVAEASHQPHEASGAEPVEATEARDSQGTPVQELKASRARQAQMAQRTLDQTLYLLDGLKEKAQELLAGQTRVTQASHQPHEASGAEPVEATEARDSQETPGPTLKELRTIADKLQDGQWMVEQGFYQLRLAGKLATKEQKLKMTELQKTRLRVKERIKKSLEQLLRAGVADPAEAVMDRS